MTPRCVILSEQSKSKDFFDRDLLPQTPRDDFVNFDF